MKRFTFWNACLWFSFLIVVTQSAGVTITGDIKVSTFSSDGETLVDQGTYSFQVSGDGHKWSMRVEYGEQYHELNGSDGTNTWTVNCNSDAEFRKVFGARADRATYPATVALVPCPFAADYPRHFAVADQVFLEFLLFFRGDVNELEIHPEG